MAQAQFRSPKGTRDILPGDAERQRALINAFADQARLAGFGHVITPMFEELGVFKRLGESTDVVTKEMYDFVAKDDKHYALRPELTASVVRAYVQHRPATPWKVWYEGPQFRYERAQAGRYRQFTQVGVEALGTEDPAIDAEIIALGWRFYASLGLTNVTLLLNSLGDETCRPAYLDALKAYFESRQGELSEQSQHTLQVNPLRVLDSKRPEDQAIIDDAPIMVDHLSPQTAEHFDGVRRVLDRLEIPFEISPRLVRGLDYYTHTVFEWVTTALGAQGTVCAGGRYDGLVELLGGKPTPGAGFAMGVDRLVLLHEEVHKEALGSNVAPLAGPVDVYIAIADDSAMGYSLKLASELRQTLSGVRVRTHVGGGKLKSQMKKADACGARFALIVGAAEVGAASVTCKALREGIEPAQATVGLPDLADYLRARL